MNNSNVVNNLIIKSDKLDGYDTKNKFIEYNKMFKNHYDTFDYLCSCNQLGKSEIKKAHKILMNDILREPGRFRNEHCRWHNFGKKCSEEVFDNILTKYAPSFLINYFIKMIEEQYKYIISEKDCWDLHNLFVYTSPFIDGNTRLARLILYSTFIKNNFNLPAISNRSLYISNIGEWVVNNLDESSWEFKNIAVSPLYTWDIEKEKKRIGEYEYEIA